jgi:hypothetical protein
MVTDIDRFEIHTNFTGTVTRVYAFTNTELPEPKNLRVLQAMFSDSYSLKPTRTVESVTEEAAAKFATRVPLSFPLDSSEVCAPRRFKRPSMLATGYHVLCSVPSPPRDSLTARLIRTVLLASSQR